MHAMHLSIMWFNDMHAMYMGAKIVHVYVQVNLLV